ncbi:MAG: riboflavin synthase [Candidatus Njordarchaeia archaeon]
MKTGKYKIGVVDTTFARVNMGDLALRELKKIYPSAEYIRLTVPGIKDLPGAAKRLIDLEQCDAVITLGWVGKKEVDKYSYLAMSLGLITVQLLTNKILIDVTIHEDESDNEKELLEITIDRIRKHCKNLVDMLINPSELIKNAGKGKRQGYPDAGSINPKPH